MTTEFDGVKYDALEMRRASMDRLPRIMLALFFMAIFTSGCASSNARKDAISETLKPAGIHEDCMELSPGQIIEYSFDSSKPLNFNIHYHEDGGMFFPLQKDNTTHEKGRFEPRKKQYYCLMWTNSQSEPVTLIYIYTMEKK